MQSKTASYPMYANSLHAPNVRKRAEGNVDTFVTTPQWLQLWQVRLLRGAAVSQNAAYMGKEHLDRHDQHRLYDGAIRACRHTRAWQQALFQIRKAGRDLVRPDAVWLKTVAACPIDWQRSLSVLGFPEPLRDQVSTNVRIAASGRGRNWSSALHILQDMRCQQLLPDAYSRNSALDACKASEGCWAVTTDVLQFLDAAIDVVGCSAAVTSMARSTQWHFASALLQESLSDFLRPNIPCFSALISAYERGSTWQRALASCADADAITAGTLTSSLGKASEWQRAAEYVHGMLPQALVPDSICFVTAMSAFKEGRQWSRSQDTLNVLRLQMAAAAPNNAYHLLVSALRDQWMRALHWVLEMGTEGVRSHLPCRNAVISVCEAASKWQKAGHVLRGLPVASLELDIIGANAAVGACRESWEHAAQLCLEHRQSSILVDSITFASLAAALKPAWSTAVDLLRSAHPLLTEIILNLVISTGQHSEIAAWSQSALLLHEFPSKRLLRNVISFNAAIGSCAGKWQVSFHLLDLLNKTSVSCTMVSFGAAVSACEKGAVWDVALDLLQRSREHPSVSISDITCNAAISACEKRGLWRTGLALFREMDHCDLANDISFNAVLGACHRCILHSPSHAASPKLFPA
ncbi:EMB2654 [Symbiodinium sp. CCMP2592]|nr:EMB2654 [Symbiodinium sp. CCMP2592]